MSPQVLADVVGVVAVEDEQCHDPEDRGSLQEVIVVVIVGILFRIGPSMPGRDEGKDEDYQLGACGMLGELVGEVGDLLLVSA